MLDEAQTVKNHHGKTYQAVRRLNVPFRLALSGTPMENRLMELWSLLSIVAPGLYRNERSAFLPYLVATPVFFVLGALVVYFLAMPLLTTVTDFTGVLGGWLAETTISGMTWQLYFRRAFSLIEFQDFIPATVKTAVFGMIIGTIASYLGFTTTQGTEGVGRTSTRSVVLSSILIIVTNVVLVKLILFMFPGQA